MRKPMEERFWEKADKSGDCWEWTAHVMKNGYGKFKYAGVMVLAHRHSYEMANGAIPAGYQVDHTCHNTTCVRPDHLRLATPKQNQENHSGPRSDNKAGVRGVSWDPVKSKWRVQVTHNGKKYAGLFESLDKAGAVAASKRVELFTHNDLDRAA